jgi:hypothetical protein
MTTLCVNDPERGDYAVFDTCSTLKSNIPHTGHASHSRPSSYTRHRHVQTGAECAIVTRRPRQLYRWIPSHRLASRLVLSRHLVQCERYHHRTRPYTQNTAAERQDTTQGLKPTTRPKVSFSFTCSRVGLRCRLSQRRRM